MMLMNGHLKRISTAKLGENVENHGANLFVPIRSDYGEFCRDFVEKNVEKYVEKTSQVRR